MITAIQAREMVQASTNKAKETAELISKKIEEVANNGQGHIEYHFPIELVPHVVNGTPIPSKFIENVAKIFSDRGFEVYTAFRTYQARGSGEGLITKYLVIQW